jgi:hypothetical protein
MRVAVFTDIHCNLPAREASLAATDAIGVDQSCCGGDLVGYGPNPTRFVRSSKTGDSRQSAATMTMRLGATLRTAGART